MKLILSDRPLHFPVLTDDTRYFDLSALKIANCVGCFGCWTKTPGRCVIRDDATRIYPCIAASDTLLYVSRLCYGSYDVLMKTMLERAIPRYSRLLFVSIVGKHITSSVPWYQRRPPL